MNVKRWLSLVCYWLIAKFVRTTFITTSLNSPTDPYTHFITYTNNEVTPPGISNELSCVAARTFCKDVGGQLATIEDSSVIGQLQSTLFSMNGKEVIIGYVKEIGSDVYNWVDGSTSSYSQWDLGFPLTDISRCFCATIILTETGVDKWRSIECSEVKPYLCKRSDWVLHNENDIEPEAHKNDYYIPVGNINKVAENQVGCHWNRIMCDNIYGYEIVITGKKMLTLFSKFLSPSSGYGIEPTKKLGLYTAYKKLEQTREFKWDHDHTSSTFTDFGNVNWHFYTSQMECFCAAPNIRTISKAWDVMGCSRINFDAVAIACERDKTICTPNGPNPCSEHGSCTRTGYLVKCVCEPDYTGRICDQKLDKCSSNPCKHGNCLLVDSDNSWTCECHPDFSGVQCQITICSPPTRVPGGVWTCPLDMHSPITCGLDCGEMYRLTGAESIMCDEDGQYRGVMGACNVFVTIVVSGELNRVYMADNVESKIHDDGRFWALPTLRTLAIEVTNTIKPDGYITVTSTPNFISTASSPYETLRRWKCYSVSDRESLPIDWYKSYFDDSAWQQPVIVGINQIWPSDKASRHVLCRGTIVKIDITVDNELNEVYFDGKLQTIGRANPANLVAPDNLRLLAIKVTGSTAANSRYIAVESWPERLINGQVENFGWKCMTTATQNWYQTATDDTAWVKADSLQNIRFWAHDKRLQSVYCQGRTAIGDCASNPCKNKGRCDNIFGRYTCTCEKGSQGLYCEQLNYQGGNSDLGRGSGSESRDLKRCLQLFYAMLLLVTVQRCGFLFALYC